MFVSIKSLRGLQNMSSRHLQDMSSRHVFKTSSRYVFKTCLQDVFKTCFQDIFKTCLQDVFNTSSAFFRLPRRLCKTSSRRLGRHKIVTLKTCLMKVLGPYPDGSLLYSNSFYQGYEFAKWLNTSMIAILKLEQNN